LQPVCFVCHSRRGNTLGSNSSANGGKDIDFSSYEKFISHAEQIKRYVYDRGVMPLSLRGYNAFWTDGGSGPELLALHLNGLLPLENQVPLNDNDEVDEPGAPVADAGPDRTTTSPVRLFGSNSSYVERYSWRITGQPSGSDAVLTDINTSRPLLTTSIDGDYEITLVASGNSDVSDSVRIKIDNTLTDATDPPDPKTLTFDNNIRTIFTTAQDPANSSEADGKACADCHQAASGGGILGVPVHWGDVQPSTGDTASNAFYHEVLSRVDFKDPENSFILKKPSNNHHYGGLREGFEVDNPANRQSYDLMLNWILEGAPEN
jgi:mono/diheme cytochrome c family protein